MLSGRAMTGLKEIFGPSKLHTEHETRLAYSYDGTAMLKGLPDAVAFAEGEEEVARLFTLANEEGFPVIPRGSGTGLSGGSVPPGCGVALVFAQNNKILEIDRENLSAQVQPGVITGKLQAAVEALGLFYPPDPGSRNICTLGGNAAEDAGGLHGLKYGTTKDYVRGLSAVLPEGRTVRSGGKAVKDVAGYNLRQLLVGSEGTLAVFTELSLKLLPKPQARRVLWAMFPNLECAAQAASAIVSRPILPFMLEFLDRVTLDCVEAYAKPGLPREGGALLLIGLDGHAEVVRQEQEDSARICREQGAIQVRLAESETEASEVMAARRAAFAALARVRPTTILEDATVPRSRLAEMVAFIAAEALRRGLKIGTFGHAGDGNLHPTFLTDETDLAEIQRVHAAFEAIFQKALQLGGTITGEHGVGLAKRGFLESQLGTESVDFMRRLKAVFDPKGVLNPGKIFKGGIRCEGRLA